MGCLIYRKKSNSEEARRFWEKIQFLALETINDDDKNRDKKNEGKIDNNQII